jgi:putative heme-binding domain-containing protein
MVYEGDLLPPRYRDAMIHADAGTRVVRAYPVEAQGAGYQGRIEPILSGEDDPLFRPVDVAAAPDGSIFVADWYDPGVGGHNVGDLTYGRIIRVAPKGTAYRAGNAPDLSSAEAAVRALSSPNQATRYLAYERLREMAGGAEEALRTTWRSGDLRERARALWLLGGLPGAGARYVQEAIGSPEPDLRITGLRVARRYGQEVFPLARKLANDPSPQVRREVALALRHDASPEAADLWADLAMRYDGRDRWYLEALGIAADGQWDRLFAAWQKKAGEGWRNAAGRDIVWRARTDAALPLLAQLIRDGATTETQRRRYFRAFDFREGDLRERTLLGLLEANGPAQAEIAALALTHLNAEASGSDPRVRPALARTLDALRGTQAFVDLAAKYEVRDRSDELIALALAEPESSTGVAAAQLALRWGALDHFRAVAMGDDPRAAESAVLVLGRAGGNEGGQLLQELATSAERPLGLRRTAMQALGQGQSGERRLLQMVQDGVVPEDLRPTAAAILFASFRTDIREAAAEHLTPPAATTADGKTLPPVAILARQRGDAEAGRAAFRRVCTTCHTAEGVGTDFGPGLSDIGAKLSRGALYTAILEPSAGVSFNYAGETIRLRNGTELVGIVGSETETEIAVRLPGGVTSRYAKSEVVSRQPLEVSLMPDGLERALTEQELVDLVAYLGTLR